VTERIGIIGVGHLAGYLVEGFRRASADVELVLSPRNTTQSADLAARFGATVADSNQSVADVADVVLVSTRPADVAPACEPVEFRSDHDVIATAAGLSLDTLADLVYPAEAAVAMPLTSAAINRSPTLLCPDRPRARHVLEMLGTVHALDREEHMAPASAITAFYGWVYALLDDTVDWTAGRGVPTETARTLVLETARAAAEMGLAHPDQSLAGLLDSLATPGGITRQGLKTIEDRHGLDAWRQALDDVLERLNG
jgi:pyrroline-5-carboxylate reductase